MVTCAACDKGREPEAPKTDAGSRAPTTTPGSVGQGARCTGTIDCNTGLTCCQTSMEGKCGGPQPPPGVKYEPCVIISTCEASCRPLPMPPYGCVFPDGCGSVSA